jgi:hypothetical protein
MRVLAFGLAAGFVAAQPAAAQDRIEPQPAALQRVGIEEKLDTVLPLQLTFKDDMGRDVALGSSWPGCPSFSRSTTTAAPCSAPWS